MKNLLIIFFVLGLAVSVVGCAMLQQSSQTHQAVENEVCEVYKVIVQKKAGIKTVTVVVLEEVDAEQKSEINTLVKEKVPDVNEVEIKIYRGKK